MKNPIVKRSLLLIGILIFGLVFSACSKNEKPGNDPTATPTGQISGETVTPKGDAGATNTPTPAADPVSPTPTEEPALTDEPLPTLMDTDTEDDDDDSSSVAGSELIPVRPAEGGDDVQTPPTPTQVPEDDPELEQRRAADWEETFLIWLPEFTGGLYRGCIAEETFDRAVFAGVDSNEVTAYIAELEAAGFVLKAEADSHASRISYSAANVDNWFAEVEYAEGNLKIGSGYYPDDSGTEERLELIWTESALAGLPRFTEGTFASDGESSDGSSHHAVFEDVAEEDVRAYMVSLAEAGFTEETDEGDSDGFIWYSAENSDGEFCDITYYDGILKIEGGR